MTPNNRLQRTVRDKVPASITQRPAAEPGRQGSAGAARRRYSVTARRPDADVPSDIRSAGEMGTFPIPRIQVYAIAV